MTDRIRMIVVGAGRGRAHLKSFLTLTEAFEVAGLVDLDEERLENALGEHELSPDLGYTSYDEALARSGCDGGDLGSLSRDRERAGRRSKWRYRPRGRRPLRATRL